MKNALVGFKDRFQQAEETVNMKVGQLKLCSLRNRKKKKKQWRKMNRDEETCGHHQVYPDIYREVKKNRDTNNISKSNGY